MELPCRRSSFTKSSIKFKVPTDEPSWLAFSSLSDVADILDGSIKHLQSDNETYVVKFGNYSSIHEEYQAAERLKELPGFIRYDCFFSCPYHFITVIERHYLRRPRICFLSEDGTTRIGGIVMPYYPERSMNEYPWKREHLPLLYNLMCQVCFALANAYDATGFIHDSLYARNVLLHPTTKKSVSFGEGITLPVIDNTTVVLMDIEHPKCMDTLYFITSIVRFLYSISSTKESDLAFGIDPFLICHWHEMYPKWTPEGAQALYDLIHALPLYYVVSERPNIPFVPHTNAPQ